MDKEPKEIKKVEEQPKEQSSGISSYLLPRRYINAIADEVARIVVSRIPYMARGTKKKAKPVKKLENALFLDTSAIIDVRIFDVLATGLISGNVVVLESILLELKHIADSQDAVRRERGRKGLEYLGKLRKQKGIKLVTLDDKELGKMEVDEKLIKATKQHKGRVVTCDYNLEKKAVVQGVVAINMNALANVLKVQAVPGDALHIKVLHAGKDPTQGVGYLDDGTMIVVEQASGDVGTMTNVVVARVIQTSAGKILFAKKI